MNKEKILESSRRENKNRDLAEMEVTAQAGNIAGRVGAAVCVVLTLIFRIFTKTYFLSPWVVYFSILTTHTLVKYAKRMENSIHKMRAAHLILSAILTMQGENAPAFSAHCNTIDNLCETVMSVFEKLGYRDRTVLGMRLGFDPHKGFVPTKVCKYLEIATAFEMTLASSASRLFHRICRRFAASMLEAGR